MGERQFKKVGNYLDYTPKEMQELLRNYENSKKVGQTKLQEYGFE